MASPPMSGRWSSYLLNTGFLSYRWSTGIFVKQSGCWKRHAFKFKRLCTVLRAIAHNHVSDAARRCVRWSGRGYKLFHWPIQALIIIIVAGTTCKVGGRFSSG
ncbi:hypothetical protein BO83DRAFT_187474 [Aspergillus eucalypticola CBS 122712]|uniref:Uncharacterized protein n=1 Tax=Aspergillus eucalypticola (strain CBS 122712 / IBT 29274) TaxID=1448314 RepID=A0A317UPL8_ASPEC|nr:uncharacterized protein BO83DRAFT_187474 [Aspergillus eucalypticola CBS 122712]PWY62497.1 hypothetical protein BO83DRAFT_187474 [Aspergillus eucalypticola CBS 122712]